jgi:hypothetical protein
MRLNNCANILDEKTSPQTGSSYITFCQICGWYGYPQEKIVVEIEGIRPEDEDGFAYKFNEYNCDPERGQKGNKHIHKYDLKLLQEVVEIALNMRNDGGCQE